jgi:transposase-like protein
MGKRKRYDSAFKKEAVKAALDALKSGGTVSTIAASLSVKENTLQKWVQNHRSREDREAVGGLSETERSELGNLRREVKRLRVEREILKKATAFFAKENA